MKQLTTELPSVLAVLSCSEECTCLRRIVSGTDWAFHFTSTFREAGAILRASRIGVVICEGHFDDGHNWKDLLNEVQKMPFPPELIVADRLADEPLWAEVLNRGCYDLLMTPLRAEEVRHVVPLAWDLWKRKSGLTAARPKPPASADAPAPSSGKAIAAGSQ